MFKHFRVVILAVFMGLILPSGVSLAAPLIGNCQVFPPDNPWNTDISAAPLHPNSAAYINNINANGGDFVHPDFGSDPSYGIPYFTVSGTQTKVPVTFDYADESDPGPYPFTPTAPVEGGGDRHVIAIDTDGCVLYETWNSRYAGGKWSAGSGAIFNLNSNALRPDGWTSADAAGLPIFPGLARCSEAMSGQINHALRFTVNRTRNTYIYPARHAASSYTGAYDPPMGLRLRLNSSYVSTHNPPFTGQSLAIVNALTHYGMILADNGSNWYISGERDQNCWNDEDLNQLKAIPGSAFEVIDSASLGQPTVVVPAPSLHLPADASNISTTQPVLDWDTITSATSYEVQFGRSIPSMTTVATPSSTSFTQYNLPTPLVSGFTYYWRVRAKVNTTPTGWSATRSFTIASAPNAAPVRNLFSSVRPPVLTWNRLSWAVHYKVQVSSNASFTSPIEVTFPENVLTYTPSLPPGTYYWHVQAQDSNAQWGNWSATETFIVDI